MSVFRGLVGLALFVLVAACAGREEGLPPQVRLADIRLLDGGLIEQRFRVDLRIGNPNDFDLPIDGLTFELELNDRPFAQGFSNRAVTVPRLGEASVPVIASTTLLNMVEQVLVLGERADLSYRVQGQVYLAGLARRVVPYERSGRMGLAAEPKPGATTRFGRTLVPL